MLKTPEIDSSKEENLKIIKRSKRIKMFIYEYYFGYSIWVKILRLIGGPLLILIGLFHYQGSDRLLIAYGGICIFFGIYLILKPLLWVLLRKDSFKTLEFYIETTPEKLIIKDHVSESEIYWEGIKKIVVRESYFVLRINKFTTIYLPFEILTKAQKQQLEQKQRELKY